MIHHSLNQGKPTNKDTSHSTLSDIKRLLFIIYERSFYPIIRQTGRILIFLTISSLSPPGQYVRTSAPPWPVCRLHTA
jgi:hypothetical protein